MILLDTFKDYVTDIQNIFDPVEMALDTADRLAEQNQSRLTHEEVFSGLR